MINPKIYLRSERGMSSTPDMRRLIKNAASAVLTAEKYAAPAEMSVLLTDDEGIRAINRDYRELDAATDVLSFPNGDENPETGRVLLGDMVISLQRCRAQGEEYGHGFEHEISYLTVHSVLHLLGYDHLDEGEEKKLMRSREKIIMEELGV